MPQPLLVTFAGSDSGRWATTSTTAVAGDPLPRVAAVSVFTGSLQTGSHSWLLRGVTSNERYVERPERDQLVARQESLERPASTCAALIPIRKSPQWWDLTQDERRRIFEASSRHIAIGLEYLPRIARRLHHSRDLGEPFDFLTWFEFAPADTGAFDDLLRRLRETEEWQYVEREVDIRLSR